MSDRAALLEASGAVHGEARSETVVVLGGGGFVGAAITRALAGAGFAVVSAQRHPGHPRDRVTQVTCDATKPAEIRAILQRASCVVNAVGGDARTMLAATRAMQAAAERGCRIIHVSSMAVYGEMRGYVREDAKLRAASRYGAAKIACETALAGSGAVIVRPGLVYGPGSGPWVGRIGRLLRRRRLGDLGKHGDGRCNLLHVRDLGEAVVAAIGAAGARGRAINLGMGAPPRWNDYLVRLGRAIGAVPVACIPGWQLAVEARLLGPPLYIAGCLSPGKIVPDAISPALQRLFAQDIVLDCRLAGQLLGQPRTRLADGVSESAGWFLETHGLPRT